MAVSKELKKYLDKDPKGQYKKTRKNISKLLAYYGYDIKDIQEVFGTKSDYYSRYFGDMVRRDKPTSHLYFTEEEQELMEDYVEAIEDVYNKATGSVSKKKAKTPKKKAKRPVRAVTTTTKASSNSKDSKVETEDAGVSEGSIQNSTLLNKLQKISEKDTTETSVKDTSETRSKVNANRQEVPTPVKTDAPEGGKCQLCSGRGWIMEKQEVGGVKKVKCPQCLGQPVKAESAEFERYGKPMLEELIENKHYLTTKFNVRTLMEENVEAYHSATRQFDNYIEFMSGVLTVLRNGDLPLKSYYLATPDGYGKKHFIYQCMKELVSFGYKPTQLLNGGVLLDLYNKREFQQINELLDGDMIFVTISSLSRTKGLGNILKYIADYAERRGIPVMLTGQVSVEIFLKDKDFNLPMLLSRYTSNGDFGHFQSEGFFGKDFYALASIRRDKMSGTLINN